MEFTGIVFLLFLNAWDLLMLASASLKFLTVWRERVVGLGV